MYVEVAVCLPLSRTFVYSVEEPVSVGCRVSVSFRKREVDGFVVGLRSDAPGMEVLPITQVVDSSPLLRAEIFELCLWISKYYVSPIGEVLKAALPPGIRSEGPLPPGGGAAKRRVRAALTRPSATLSRGERDPAPGFPPILTDDQARAFEAITAASGFHPVLLHGVTGSGKTEVYIRAAEHFLASGKSSLIHLPEIGLTPQRTDRFSERFPVKTAILHSSLTKRQRIDEWVRINAGEAPLVIGTRSAVFAPLEKLGLIVVDEEHETSYKQEEMPRYNARDVAVMRAKLAGATVVLGSATPSMESFRNAEG